MTAILVENISSVSHKIAHRNDQGNGCRPLRELDTFALRILELTPPGFMLAPLRGLSDST